ncbi:MAG: hypothetical protein Q8R55_06555 [Candidatus Taylorbacteria bacterium]|nr:hypothetical protein [Candidatus Taylorbacteria bacterium]
MLDKLSEVERALPELLKDEARWNGLFIDYHPPFVERLWLQWGDYRISLHRIHPCTKEEALFHPHPWASAMRIVHGSYEMAIGYGSGSDNPPVAALIIATQGSSYEMTNPDAWHYVRPIGEPVYTLMVTGKPWKRESPQADKVLQPLSDQRRKRLFDLFKKSYPTKGVSL